MNRIIKNIAVIGSGIMGSRIACHFANAGCKVYLLDIIPDNPTKEEESIGLSLDSPQVRNRIVNDNLNIALKTKPSPVYEKSVTNRIITGNLEDNLNYLSTCDWVIEAIIENLNIKKSLFEKIEPFRKKGSIITSNTSGIPIELLIQNRSDDFAKHFCGTHFFNPPRYLQLLEVIPSTKTDPKVINFIMNYGDVFLGKTTVTCKDTPAFIANRVGVFVIMKTFELMQKYDLSIEDIDLITGPITGKPKSATFRTLDIVGLDTLIHVTKYLQTVLKDDEENKLFETPKFIDEMLKREMTGVKSGKGFYKKHKTETGESEIQVLDFDTFEYRKKERSKITSIPTIKLIENLPERLKAFQLSPDKAGEFFREFYYSLFVYISHRLPEITDAIYKIDDCMKTGFGWEIGPFEIWDILGVEQSYKEMQKLNFKPADWITNFITNGNKSFYTNHKHSFYDIKSQNYIDIPNLQNFIILDNIRDKNTIWENSGSALIDLGDGVLNLEFRTKMNAIGSEIIEGLNKSIDIAEEKYSGLVIGNDAPNFSAGANLALLLMLAVDQEYDELDYIVRVFQKTMLKMKYSGVPIVSAPHGLTLGGACELCLQSDSVMASAETYIGLVEMGVGLIPAGGGTKEMVFRASKNYKTGQIELPELINKFLLIGQAKVATSAAEAFNFGIFRNGTDKITINPKRVIQNAKRTVLELSSNGYTPPNEDEKIKVLGQNALGALLVGAHSYFTANYITEHDKKIAEKLAYIMCGGNLTGEQFVTEQYLMDLEREAFLSLLGEKKTLERIEYMLKKGKPLRN